MEVDTVTRQIRILFYLREQGTFLSLNWVGFLL